jgi:molybdopterin adenylyltransferase
LEGIIRAICTSEKRGTEKKQTEMAEFVKNYGISGDAHAGNWHRQVSLLSYEKTEEFNRKGADVKAGDFGENLLVEGIDFRKLPVGTILKSGEVCLKITQIGKECHNHCRIYQRMGECIMPEQGVFAEVIQGGMVHVGDGMTVQLPGTDRALTAAVLTLSDKASRGERVDESGPAAVKILKDYGYDIIETLILPDEQDQIERELIRLSDGRQADLIITTGGTGFAKRDRTPEATLAVAERIAPGIAEAMRMESMKITERAMLSRAVSVIRGNTLIVNLPGSVKAVEENLGFVIPQLEHGIRILNGTAKECGRR